MAEHLEGKVALVAGAGQGIGKAIAFKPVQIGAQSASVPVIV